MPFDVKMPQLGMNQDSAVIVAWLKAPGDAVAEGEPIFEVETDKATMEVEAQAAGFLGRVLALEGADVPVGEVIAEIVETADAVSAEAPPAAALEKPTPTSAAQAEPAPPSVAPAEPAPPLATPAEPPSKPTPLSSTVLASPKAKRLAQARGIDLAALRASGAPEPIHVADLGTVGAVSTLMARAEGSGFDALLAKSDATEARPRLLARFAASAWARVTGSETGVAIRHVDGTITPADGAKLTLTDLSETRLTAYTPASGTTLAVARDGGDYVLTLSFAEPALSFAHAVAVLDDIAARIDDPIRQLL